MKNLYEIQDELYIIDNNEKVTQNGIWAKCSFTGDILKNRNGQYAHKVILTTNNLLIKDGVQAIDDEFLEWFVKNPSCEEVEIEYDKDIFPYGVETSNGYGWYKIIIPKEEPKQETLEEATENYVRNEPDATLKLISKYSFKDGTKWQAERMYSEEEVIEFGEMIAWNMVGKTITESFIRTVSKELFEQFKKK
jgi:hypothetical protein